MAVDLWIRSQEIIATRKEIHTWADRTTAEEWETTEIGTIVEVNLIAWVETKISLGKESVIRNNQTNVRTNMRDLPILVATIFQLLMAPITLISREELLQIILLIGPLLAREIGTIGMTEVIEMIELIEVILVIGMIEIQGLLLPLLAVEVTIVAIVILEMVVVVMNTKEAIILQEEILKILTQSKQNERFDYAR